MSRLDKKQVVKNISSSWFSLGLNVLVGIFLSPYILHHLGDTAFGIWVLIFSVTGYYGLFDLGVRSSIVRYVSKYAATDDREGLAKLVNTSLFSYSCIGVLSMAVTVVTSFYVDRLFKIPPELQGTARLLLLMVGFSVALGFPLGIFGGFLEGLQRFYINNATSVFATVVRAVLIVMALQRGYGLLTVAIITISLPIISNIIRAVAALRLCPVPFGTKYVDRETFRQMANYSAVTFMIMVAGRLKFKTDEIVIGAFLSASAITYFNIGARIVDYAGEVVNSLAQNALPMASQSEATGDSNRLRKVLVAANRFSSFTIFPITAVLLILGRSIIEVWVGQKYVADSYRVLVILLVPSTVMWAQAASGRVLFGISKHKTWAYVTMAEGISNLILSIILVRPYGIIGDAYGTAIPLMCSMVLFMPWHLCRLVGIRMRTYLRETYSLPILITLPLVGALLLMRRWYHPHNYRGLVVQLVIAAAVYGLGLLWAIGTRRAFQVGELAPKMAKASAERDTDAPTVAYQEDI